ncbi:phosphoglycerate kinase [Candidatus Gottesmanbacteria bacterium CG11_big_fil_rev_8_21_14_0_20_37_11]|uniref:Phosphoglycerate kinase n=4 Tax=Microgenomates group TaxID=1794810 RepID=A0A447ITN3_9BACT|nr:MAG: phosphoglycerate kinase [Candidatus Gottesmanbacteria bacterium CG1_02_37_22]PIP32137.1 MAG: phosphoglycerate kinase [Candidatus Gottesmanbacteria bacterium CG23_combo_of_CG06-09_8_20_14_all_37_19]PIR08906.1 MAG: phosphoglycerate kinase [Candidatus Gottesmanbacteria bacterium CG11_big_fil_rev_8_21_14_0_20_37_11]PIZ02227.1 MAG: phosphoglycerate kinase [Candidatus Gottesmanbacteria bacterium CG_4_10_14_0_8_um_filter_37_24]VDS10887.1 Phosphoglycerate kinase [uncultured Microgenomates group
MNIRTIHELKNIRGKRVLLTVDFNISLHNGNITNDTRIVEALPTINYLRKEGAKIILISHLGRPRGYDKKFSLRPVAERLRKLTKIKVNLIDDFWEGKAINIINKIPEDELILLENIRFYKGEEDNDKIFSKHLAKMADFFVNDAFGTSHRVHSSIVGIADYLPSFAGMLMAKEIQVLSDALNKPARPFLVLIGGAKTPEKIAVIERILDIADTIALGGAISNTFLAAWGFGTGKSLVDYEMVEMARVVFWKAAKKHCALILPQDLVISDRERSKMPSVIEYNKIPNNVAIYDIGPKTQKYYCKLINEAKTIIWNGPMGFYEDPLYKKGTDAVLKCLSNSNAYSILGGGDTITSIKERRYLEKISHISTGGSAMLSFLEKGTLPGIDVLIKN